MKKCDGERNAAAMKIVEQYTANYTVDMNMFNQLEFRFVLVVVLYILYFDDNRLTHFNMTLF